DSCAISDSIKRDSPASSAALCPGAQSADAQTPSTRESDQNGITATPLLDPASMMLPPVLTSVTRFILPKAFGTHLGFLLCPGHRAHSTTCHPRRIYTHSGPEPTLAPFATCHHLAA